jgi:hypothetical protein
MRDVVARAEATNVARAFRPDREMQSGWND